MHVINMDYGGGDH